MFLLFFFFPYVRRQLLLKSEELGELTNDVGHDFGFVYCDILFLLSRRLRHRLGFGSEELGPIIL